MKIRTVKPQLFEDADLAEMDIFTRYLFIGLFDYCDDNGVGLDDEVLICMKIFPRDFYRNPTEVKNHLHRALLTLSGNLPEDIGRLPEDTGGRRKVFVERYFDGRNNVLFIKNWDKHQKISHPAKSEYLRPEEVPENVMVPTPPTELPEDDGNLPEDIGNFPLGKEGKGRERNKEGKGKEAGISPAPRKSSMGINDSYTTQFEQFWAVYPWQDSKPDAFAAWREALVKTSATIIIAAASNYAAQQQQTDAPYTMKPANWLRNEGWNNKPQPRKRVTTRTDRATAEWEQDAEIYRKLKAQEGETHAITS
jgi:hypothetical protein